MPSRLLVGLELLLLLGFLPRLVFPHNVGYILRSKEPGLYLSAIPIPIGLLVSLGLLSRIEVQNSFH